MTGINALDAVQKAIAVTDLEGFVELWDPDGVWTHSGHSQISGPHSGHWEIAEMVRIALEVSGGTLKAQPIELVAASEDSVLGYFQLDAARPGATIHQHGFQRWVVDNGKIVSLDTVYCDQDEFDEFFR
jgi:ketosteroid isomerase-like protein